jgi:transcriptional regulator with XRE-family HTH domain
MTATLRKAIADSGMSFKGLERETGITRQSLMKFAAGETSLRLDIADRLAAYFALELTPTKRKGK